LKNISLKTATMFLVAMLSGCATLPTSGPVRIGPDLQSGLNVESLYYSPSSPLDGASPADILNGFLAAQTGPQNDYAVAREYLSESFRSTWNPNQEVLIQRGSPEVAVENDEAATVNLELAATVDADGRYSELTEDSVRTLEYSFIKENGQWRIGSAPDLTVLIRPVFDVIFRSFSVYFFDRQQKYLIPDLRWFPNTASTGTRLVNAMLRGPSPWLRPAVVSAVPSGTRLSIDAVTIDGSTALVDLTARALVATSRQRMLMKVQLDETLSQLENVSDVSISIERSRQEIASMNESFQAEPNPTTILLTDNGAEVQTGTDINLSNSLAEFFDSISATDMAVSSTSDWIVALAQTGVWRTRLDPLSSETQLLDARKNLLNPVFDKQGWIWSVSSDSGSSFLVTAEEGENRAVTPSWLGGVGIKSFDISPEGSRVALLTQSQPSRIWLSSIVRDRQGTPLSLSTPIELPVDTATLTSVSWIDNISVAVLNVLDGYHRASFSQVGGTSSSVTVPVGARRLVSGGSNNNYYLLTESNVLYQYRNISWVQLREDVKSITVAH
jgi:hypothetical protein